MNVQLKDITVTARDGRVSHLEQVYIRGSHVRFFIVPDMLRCVFCHSRLLAGTGRGKGEAGWISRPMGMGVDGRHANASCLSWLTGTRPCSAAATSAAGASVSREEGPRSAGRGPAAGLGDKGLCRLVGWRNRSRTVEGRGVVGFDLIWRLGCYNRASKSGWEGRSKKRMGKIMSGNERARLRTTRSCGRPCPKANRTRCPQRMAETSTLIGKGTYRVLLSWIYGISAFQG